MTGIFAGLLWILMVGLGFAQDLSGLARLQPAQSLVTRQGNDITLRLSLSQPVPWRVRVMDDPPRVVLDFREVDWTGIDQVAFASAKIARHRAGVFRPGWSRLVLELIEPMTVSRAGMLTGADVAVEVTLVPADPAEFAKKAAMPEPAEWASTEAVATGAPDDRGLRPLVMVLDPGHGGLDPGAERGGVTEADLMLTFARELKEMALRDGTFKVVLTREEDVFVPLETRISIARAAGATLFVSLHADVVTEGEAVGATIYTLSAEASDAASTALAERHDRDDLLAGIDLSAQDDQVVGVLMDMARTETVPRVMRLSQALETAFRGAGVTLHREPQQQAGFSVLKSPDIPSVLVELGFLSSAVDLKRLVDPEVRTRMAGAMLAGIKQWQANDAALRAARNP